MSILLYVFIKCILAFIVLCFFGVLLSLAKDKIIKWKGENKNV